MRGSKAEKTNGRRQAGVNIQRPPMRKSPAIAHSTGTMISLARTMLSRVRAADSIARGLLRKRFTSCSSAELLVRSASTSVLIFSYCIAATRASARVRIVTVTQRAKVARMIVTKIVHDGIMPPRRRTSVRVPTTSAGRSRTGASEGSAREATLCARSLSSQ